MKPIYIFFLLVIVISGCNNQEKKTTAEPVVETNLIPTDTVRLPEKTTINDSIYPMEIGGIKYTMVVCPGEAPKEDWEDGIFPITLRIINDVTKDTLDKEFFADYNRFDNLEKHAPGVYVLSMYLSGGGSSWRGHLYLVKTKPTIHLQKLCEFGELDSWKFNKKGTNLLFFEGIWGDYSSIDDFECHHCAHCQMISNVKIKENSFSKKIIGSTKYKYDFILENLDTFKIKDPILFNKINWTEFDATSSL